MSEADFYDDHDKSATRASLKAMSALYKLLGWVALGVGFGFAVTLFTYAARSQGDTDKITSLAAGLICLLLTILIYVIANGFAQTVRMFLEIEISTSNLARKLSQVVERIEIVAEETPSGPRIEEIEPPPNEE